MPNGGARVAEPSSYTSLQWLLWYGSRAKSLATRTASSPYIQFLASLATIFAVGKSGAAQWLVKNREAVVYAMGITTVLQFMQIFRDHDAHFQQVIVSVSAVETTSQVCATRMNIIEWRR